MSHVMIHFTTRGWQSNGNNLFSSLRFDVICDVVQFEFAYLQRGTLSVWREGNSRKLAKPLLFMA